MASNKTSRYSIHKGKGVPLLSAFLAASLVGNCGLVLYSHLGLSFEVFTDLPPPPPSGGSPAPAPAPAPGSPAPPPAPPASYDDGGSCNRRRLTAAKCANDMPAMSNKGEMNRNLGQTINTCNVMLLTSPACAYNYFVGLNTYSNDCSGCMADFLHHTAKNCLASCMTSAFSDTCIDCQRRTGGLADFDNCAGFSYEQVVLGKPSASPPNGNPAPAPEKKWYSIGEPGRMSFTKSVRILLDEGAYFLAIILMIASGVNPYLECVLLGIAWFVPMPKERRGRLLWWINRAGRWSFLDVFLVVLICSGFSLSIASVNLTIETMWPIYAFGLATIWARLLGLFVEAGHRFCALQDGESASLAPCCLAARSEKCLELVAGATALVLLILIAAGSAGMLLDFVVTVGNPPITSETEFTPFAIGTLMAEKDLAGARGVVLLAVPYWLWGMVVAMLVAVLLLLALILGPLGLRRGKRLLMGVCDMVGSAASLDVLMLGTALTVGHFGTIVLAAMRCINSDLTKTLKVESSVGWGFYVLLAAVPAQWVLQEVTLALHDRPADRPADDECPKQAEAVEAQENNAAAVPELEKGNNDTSTAEGDSSEISPKEIAPKGRNSISM